MIFSTWEGFEVDKCASIWLIKRFVDKAAIIKFFPKGEFIDQGIPFDTPDAKFRRYHNMSTYESILRYYKLNDPKVVYIGKIIHDIEVNVWERKQMKETHMVQREVNQIISNSSDNKDVIDKSIKFFDSLYQKKIF
ncbi:MAG: chromate resistance protein ChrB domain-containing protein [Planctomycetota bacterium]